MKNSKFKNINFTHFGYEIQSNINYKLCSVTQNYLITPNCRYITIDSGAMVLCRGTQ